MNINKLILKSLNKSTSLEEYNTLEAWKNESKENLEFLNKMQQDYKNIEYKEFDKEKAWNNINSHLQNPLPKSNKKYYLIAGLVLALLSVGAYFYLNNENAPEIFKTENSVQQFALMDNSEIWLNSNSKVSYLSDFKKERRVDLSGEAFFEVESNKDNPFIIELNSSNFIKVVGTSFNVINTKDEFDLTVYSGKVEFHALNRVIHLKKNDRVVKSNGAFVKIVNTDENLLSWKNKELIFDDIDLIKAISKIESHYNVNIELNKSIDISNCSLRSKYTNENISEVLTEFSEIFEVFEYNQVNNKISISKLKCK